MLIGICSDSHDRYQAVEKAMAIFDREKVQHIIHCGDVGGKKVFDALAGRSVRYVWGNTDYDRNALEPYAQNLGIAPPGSPPLMLEWGGKTIAVFHGHEKEFRDAETNLSVDYILSGHTHRRHDTRIGDARKINPGALFRAEIKTVATLDLEKDQLQVFEVI